MERKGAGKKETKAQKREVKELKAAKRREARNGSPAPGLALALRGLALLAVLAVTKFAGSSPLLRSEAENMTSVWIRLVFLLLIQSSATSFMSTVLLLGGRLLCGESWLSDRGSVEMTEAEKTSHDPSIPWPRRELLNLELQAFADKKGQPFSLNHVTGKRRSKDALVRIGMNLGSLLAVWTVGHWMEGGRSFHDLGLTPEDSRFWSEASVGFLVGVGIVGFTFVVELAMGWIHFLQFFEVFDSRENFASCIFWDVVFHLNVSLNEELPVRGWMLKNVAESFAAHFGLQWSSAFVLAMLVQSGFFVLMHLPSPGGTKPLSILNIFLGGVAGGLNVLLTGGRLGFTLGWHFGWNISMGNVFGLSTSGIPISATFIGVAPHPEKVALHGGVFGPEGGVVSPAAYCIGMALLLAFYS